MSFPINNISNLTTNTSFGRKAAIGVGAAALGGLGVYSRQKMREDAVTKGMENFYKNHPQQMAQSSPMKVANLLKLASEDKVCEEKLAFVYDAMEDKDVGQDISDEIEFLLGEVEESLEKNAGIFDSLKGGISSIGGAAKSVAGAAKPYAGAAAVGAASLVGSALVNDMYTSARLALSRNRNYKSMLEADPELKQHPAEKVKALFNTLHEKGGPEMSGDPLIASAFVKQQLELPPQFLLEQVHKLVGTGAALNKSRQMGSFDLGRLVDAGRPKEKTPNVTNNYNYPSQDNNCPNCGASSQNFNVQGISHGVSLKECMSCGHLF